MRGKKAFPCGSAQAAARLATGIALSVINGCTKSAYGCGTLQRSPRCEVSSDVHVHHSHQNATKPEHDAAHPSKTGEPLERIQFS